MAKNQSFGDKTGKTKNVGKSCIKLIRSERSTKTGALRFFDEMVRVPEGKSADGLVKELLDKKA